MAYIPCFIKLSRSMIIGLIALHVLPDFVGTDICRGYTDYLVSGPRGVPDENITASTYHPGNIYTNYEPKNGRLYTANNTDPKQGCWSPLSATYQEYIQVTFGDVKIITSVLTQGDAFNYHRATKYQVLHSMDGIEWSLVTGSNNDTTFPGNYDSNTVVRNEFLVSVEAKYMRINPTEWLAYVGLRFDFLGCTKVTEYNDTERKSYRLGPQLTASDTQQLVPSSIKDIRSLGHCAIECHKQQQCETFAYNTRETTCTNYQRRFNFTVNVRNDMSLGELGYFYETSKKEWIILTFEFKPLFDGRRYYKIYTTKASLENASNVCSYENARPLSVTDLFIMKVIQEDIRRNTILATQMEYFVDGAFSDGAWNFHTGKEIPNDLWGKDEPDEENGKCVSITGMGLKTTKCTKKLFFICEMDIFS